MGAEDSRKREASFPRRRRLPVVRTKTKKPEAVPQLFVMYSCGGPLLKLLVQETLLLLHLLEDLLPKFS